MLLGIDLGTASVKATLLDGDGHAQTTTRAPCDVHLPRPGWAESDPQSWLDAVDSAVLALPVAQRRDVRAIGFSGQMHGVVLCQADALPLRPAILWMDSRSAEVLDAYPADTRSRTGNAPAAGMAGASLVWLARHEPTVLQRARWALQPKDWLRLRLGGMAAADPSDASGTLLAGRDGLWDEELVRALGLPAELLPPVIRSDARAGVLSAAMAQRWGMQGDVALIAGAADTAAAALGAGLLRHGQAQLTTGSGGQIIVLRDQCPPPADGLNVFRSAGPPGCAPWYVMAAMQNVGIALEWARGLLGLDWAQAYGALRAARRTDIHFLPYLTGERTPLMDPAVRGAWVGLGVADDRASLMRAAIEGVAFALRAGWEALARAGHGTATLGLAGGGSVHPLWSQLLADVLQVRLTRVPHADASARGAALLAGLGIGQWLPAQLSELSAAGEIIEPAGDCAAWQARYARFVELTAQACIRPDP